MYGSIIAIICASVGLAFALGVAWWLWWRLPKQQVNRLRFAIRDPKARADVEDNFRKTIGQVLGGAAVLLGAAFAYVQFTTQRQEFEEQQKASRDLLISNQVAKGFELLGNKDNQMQQRLGGIYALEGVMNTSEQYRNPVLEALCAFVRDETKDKTGDEPPATDIQAALTVIGRRTVSDISDHLIATLDEALKKPGRPTLPNLSDAHIPKSDLSGAILENAKLGTADLRGADLESANLRDAFLFRTKLSKAHLNGAALHGAFLWEADLSHANLLGAKLEHAILNGADLDDAELGNTDLSNADLTGAKNLTQAQLKYSCGTDVKLDPPLTIKPCQK